MAGEGERRGRGAGSKQAHAYVHTLLHTGEPVESCPDIRLAPVSPLPITYSTCGESPSPQCCPRLPLPSPTHTHLHGQPEHLARHLEVRGQVGVAVARSHQLRHLAAKDVVHDARAVSEVAQARQQRPARGVRACVCVWEGLSPVKEVVDRRYSWGCPGDIPSVKLDSARLDGMKHPGWWQAAAVPNHATWRAESSE